MNDELNEMKKTERAQLQLDDCKERIEIVTAVGSIYLFNSCNPRDPHANSTPVCRVHQRLIQQGSVMCLLSILNQQKQYGGNIYLSIYLIIQLVLQSALSVNGNIYFYRNYGDQGQRNLFTLKQGLDFPTKIVMENK